MERTPSFLKSRLAGRQGEEREKRVFGTRKAVVLFFVRILRCKRSTAKMFICAPTSVEWFSEIYRPKLNACNFQLLFPVNRIVQAQTRQSVNREHTRQRPTKLLPAVPD
jgi:hypothetical protein